MDVEHEDIHKHREHLRHELYDKQYVVCGDAFFAEKGGKVEVVQAVDENHQQHHAVISLWYELRVFAEKLCETEAETFRKQCA